MNRARRAAVVGSVSATVFLTTGLLTAGGAPAHAAVASAPQWRIVATIHYGAGRNASGYSAVVALRRDDAWVFGGTNPGGTSSPTAEHWNGARWQASPLPPGLGSFIVAADASSASNVWAVGDGYALRWNGAQWYVAKAWPRRGQLTSVAAIDSADVWVFGAAPFSGVAGLGTWHFNGRAWIRSAGLASSIYRASAAGRHDIWAITAAPRGGTVAHYDGRTWKRARSADAALADTQLNDVLAVSPGSVWVSGTSPPNGSHGRLILAHWDGLRWRRFVAPWGMQRPERFAPDGAGGIWVPVVTGGRHPAAWILHLSRAGRWTRTLVAAGTADKVGVGDLALIPGTRSLWGSGGLLTRAGGDAAIWAHPVAGRRAITPADRDAPAAGTIRDRVAGDQDAMRPEARR